MSGTIPLEAGQPYHRAFRAPAEACWLGSGLRRVRSPAQGSTGQGRCEPHTVGTRRPWVPNL